MLERMSIVKFQSHNETHLEFHPGINILIGDNHAGKTAVLRALYVLAFNPPGYLRHYRRHQKHWPTIEIEWDKHTIVRDKDGYKLDGTRYSAVKGTVPKDIADILNLRETNFKMQRDELFLISASPGARAKIVGSATGLEEQEVLTEYCTKKIREITDSIKIKEHLKTITRKRISELDNLNTLAPKFTLFDEQLKRIATMEETFNQVSEAIKVLKSIEDIVRTEEKLKQIRRMITLATTNEATIIDNEKNTVELKEVISNLKSTTTLVSKEDKIQALRRKKDGLMENIDKAQEMSREIGEIKNLVTGLFDVQTKMVRIISATKEARSTWKDIMKQLGKCPFCGK